MNLNKLVVHAGGIFPNPTLNNECAANADTLPGTVVVKVNGKFKVSADGTEASIKYIADKNYLECKGINEAIKQGEQIIGIHPLSGMFFNIRAKAGAYKKGDALAIDSGMIKSGGNADSAFYAEETITTTTDGELVRVVIK